MALELASWTYILCLRSDPVEIAYDVGVSFGIGTANSWVYPYGVRWIEVEVIATSFNNSSSDI